MTGFTDPFGGSSIQPAEVSYRAVALSTNLVLEWPPASEANAIARVLDVTPSGAGLSLTLPDATAVSPGYDFLINNLGANSFDVKDASGGSLVTVFTGESKYLLLRVASTPAGAWRVIAFGAQTSAADPLALAGLGLTPNATKLDVSLQTVSFSAPYVLTMADRTKNFVWTGGVGTLTLLTSASAGQYFFFEIANRGTGVLTINTSGGDLINGQASQAFQPGDSAFVLADGASGWYTVGMGRNQQFNFTLLSKAISTGNYTLTPTEAANVVQKYTGVLVANVTITLPSVVQVYYVSNQTTGAFSVTFKTAGVGTTVVVPTGQNAVLFCDGTNVLNNSTTVSGFTSLQLAVGSAASPSLSYIGDAASGLFQPTTSTLAVSTGGTERMRWANALATLATPLSVTGGVTATGTYTAPLGAVGAPAYTFAGDSNNGWWSPSADAQAWSTGGSERMRLDSSGNLMIGTTSAGGRLTATAPGTAGAATVIGILGTVASGVAATETRLHIAAGEGAARGVYIAAVNTGGGNNAQDLVFASGAASAAPTDRGRFDSNGQFYVGVPSSNQYLRLSPSNGGLYYASAGAAAMRIDADPADGVSASTVQFNRITNTVGTVAVQFLRGDGSTTVDHVLHSGSTGVVADMCRNGGSMAVGGLEVGYKGLPTIGNTATATITGNGRAYLNSGNITINNGVFSAGNELTVYNNSGSPITITQGTITTMRLAGTATTGSRTLAARGYAKLFFPDATTCVVSGAGVS